LQYFPRTTQKFPLFPSNTFVYLALFSLFLSFFLYTHFILSLRLPPPIQGEKENRGSSAEEEQEAGSRGDAAVKWRLVRVPTRTASACMLDEDVRMI
jgi:hypothetical protein